MTKKIFVICGSTRKESVNLQIIHHIARTFGQSFAWDIFNDIGLIPHFNPDLDTETPPAIVADFRKRIESADALLICTPEYVFSLPGSFKNAMEWLVSTVVLSDKPAALITASSQGLHAHDHLQKLMNTLGTKCTDCSLLIQAPKTKVTIDGVITDSTTLKEIDELMKRFSLLIDQYA